MATAPAMPILLAGDRPGAAYFDALDDYLAFARNPPAACAYRSILRTVADSTYDVLNMDVEDYDRNSIHSSSDLSVMQVQTDGRYDVRSRLAFASNTTGYRVLELRGNAGGDATAGFLLARDVRDAVGGNITSLEVNFSRVFTTGDTIEAFGWQNSGAGLALDFGIRKCELEIIWRGTT